MNMKRLSVVDNELCYTTGEAEPRTVNLTAQTQDGQPQPTLFRVVIDGNGKAQVQLLLLANSFCGNRAWARQKYSFREYFVW
jgi:hypothetical protein